MVFSCNETFSIDLRAASDAFRMASETSFALPNPQPTIPSWSPATINALKLKRRPPFTTFAQRLMKTAFSGRVCQNFDFSVIKKSAAVENDVVDLFREGAFRNRFADRRRRYPVG